MLGDGGQGVAHLWIRQANDANNIDIERIVQRVVAKDCKLINNAYNNPEQWYNDPPAGPRTLSKPREYFAQSICANNNRLMTKVVFLAVPDPNRFRYYPVPKVSVLVVKAIVQQITYDDKQIGDFGSGRLTNAAEVIARNPELYMNDTHTVGFEPHEANNAGTSLMYQAQTETWIENHVQAVLSAQAANPQLQQLTAGQARAAVIVPNNVQIRILSPTNVWQIDRTVLCMMQLRHSPDQIDYHAVHRVVGPAHPPRILPRDSWVPNSERLHAAGTGNTHATYSAALKVLIHHCLQVDHAARPTPAQLLARCTAEIAATYAADRERPANLPYSPGHVQEISLQAVEADFFPPSTAPIRA